MECDKTELTLFDIRWTNRNLILEGSSEFVEIDRLREDNDITVFVSVRAVCLSSV